MVSDMNELDALMTEWASSHRQRGWKTFISDGFVDEELYLQSSPKICFFLKEAYSKDEGDDWNLTAWLSGGAMTRMWGSVAEWTYGIRGTTISHIPAKPSLSDAQKTALLKTISVMNVKKSNGSVQSNYADLLQYAQSDQHYLRRELELLNPDVIVCGNNSSLLRLLYGSSVLPKNKVDGDGLIDYDFMSRNGYVLMGEKIILDYYHPANQYPSIMNYYTICSLYQQALKLKG